MPDLTDPLAAPLTLPCGAVLPNRLAKAAMSEALADPATGAATDELVRLYARWGAGGAGLLLTGHVIVDPSGLAEVGNVLVADARHVDALRRWAAAAQAGGARLWMQLNHAGRQSPRRLSRQPLAPSAVPMRGFAGMFAPPRALAEPEILALVDRFAGAAAIARDAGFSGVELHAAHGYLISQFLSPHTNRRDDAWGGDAARRRAFLLAVVAAVRARVGAGFPIGVKLNSADFQRGGFTIEESIEVARALAAAGVDLLEISGGSYEMPAMAKGGELPADLRDSTREREAYFLAYAERIRAATRLPLMLTGGMRSRVAMEGARAAGIDVIGMARPLAHAPDLPGQLLRRERDAAPVVRIRSRIRRVDDALQAAWFQVQLHRMAHGRDPDPHLSRTVALYHGLRAMVVGRRSALATAAPAAAPTGRAAA